MTKQTEGETPGLCTGLPKLTPFMAEKGNDNRKEKTGEGNGGDLVCVPPLPPPGAVLDRQGIICAQKRGTFWGGGGNWKPIQQSLA